MDTCRACAKPATCRGYCNRHYRYLLDTGRLPRFRSVDAGRAREHINALRERKWSLRTLEAATGLSRRHVAGISSGLHKRIRPETEAKILAVPLVMGRSSMAVNATGARRRLRALVRIGWPLPEIASRLGSSHRYLANISCGVRDAVSSALHARIAELYEELSAVPGPSRAAMAVAARHRFAPPLAWDDDTIDDPKAKPQGVAKGKRRGKLPPLEDLLYLLDQNYTPAEIALRFGVRVDSVHTALHRKRSAA